MGTKDNETISLRQICLRCGFNVRTLHTLLDLGVLIRCASRVVVASLKNLVEGEHYVCCLECGAFMSMVLPAHLSKCSGVSLEEYHKKYPGSPLMCSMAKTRKIKTQTQREAQSKKLKARFQTPAGEVTRKQIQEASIQMQAGEYGIRAAEHLRRLNADPEVKIRRSLESKLRWKNGGQREVIEGWHRDHREESLAGAAHARRYILRKRTKPHLMFKAALEANGVPGFVTEYEVGYHSIDEACPGSKVAVEVDGCYWHGCQTCGFPGFRETQRQDRSKETFLKNRDWVVIRVRACEIKEDILRCVARVRAVVEARQLQEMAA